MRACAAQSVLDPSPSPLMSRWPWPMFAADLHKSPGHCLECKRAGIVKLEKIFLPLASRDFHDDDSKRQRKNAQAFLSLRFHLDPEPIVKIQGETELTVFVRFEMV